MSLDAMTRRAGFSLLESMITLLLLGTVVGGLATATIRGLHLFQESGAQLEVRARASRGLDRAVRELVGCARATLDPQLDPIVGLPLPWTEDLAFRRADSWAAGVTTLGEPMRLLFVLSPGESDDGTDENGNGLVDEGELVLVVDDGGPNERRVTLANEVPELLEGELPNGADDNGNGLVDERGFCVSRDGDLLLLRLSTTRIARGGNPIVCTEEAAIAVRND